MVKRRWEKNNNEELNAWRYKMQARPTSMGEQCFSLTMTNICESSPRSNLSTPNRQNRGGKKADVKQ